MAIKYLDNISLGGNQITNVALENIGSNPAGYSGQIIFNTATASLNYYNGSGWVVLDGSGDISGVTAGNGLTGGGTTGNVTLSVDYVGADNIILEAQDLSSSAIGLTNKIMFSDGSNDVSFANVSDLPFSNKEGTVTSVATTHAGNAFTASIGGSSTVNPSVNIAMAGTAAQYINGLGNLITFPTDAGGTVTRVGALDGTFVSSSSADITTAGDLRYDLSATGTPSSSTFLRGDNVWATVPGGYTSWTLGSNTGADNAIVNSDAVDIVGISNITGSISTVGTKSTVSLGLTASGVTAGVYTLASITVNDRGIVTAAASGSSGAMTSWDLKGDSGTNQTITNTEVVDFQGGVGITTSAIASNILKTTLDLSELPALGQSGSNQLVFLQGGTTQGKVLFSGVPLNLWGVPTANLSIGTQKLTNVVDPTAAQDGATKNYVDTTFAGSGALIFQGGYAANTAAPSGAAVLKGFTYVVTVAGTGVPANYWSPTLEVGDLIIANQDAPTNASQWTEVNKNIDVASATVQGIANFPTAGGLTVASGAVSMPTVVAAGSVGSASQSLSLSTDVKGRVTARTAQNIAITASQVTNFAAQTLVEIKDREFSATIGDGSSIAIVVTHNLGQRNVMVDIFSNAAPYDTLYATVERTSTNTITVRTTQALGNAAAVVLIKAIG
jgi:hypothetical protein